MALASLDDHTILVNLKQWKGEKEKMFLFLPHSSRKIQCLLHNPVYWEQISLDHTIYFLKFSSLRYDASFNICLQNKCAFVSLDDLKPFIVVLCKWSSFFIKLKTFNPQLTPFSSYSQTNLCVPACSNFFYCTGGRKIIFKFALICGNICIQQSNATLFPFKWLCT